MRDEVHYRHADLGPAATAKWRIGRQRSRVKRSAAPDVCPTVLLLESSMEAKMLLVRVLVSPIRVYARHCWWIGTLLLLVTQYENVPSTRESIRPVTDGRDT